MAFLPLTTMEYADQLTPARAVELLSERKTGRVILALVEAVIEQPATLQECEALAALFANNIKIPITVSKAIADGLAVDPANLEGPGRTREEMAADARELNRIAPTPSDKFALMLGLAAKPVA